MKKTYKGNLETKNKIYPILIENDFKTLRFTIDEFNFIGLDFDGFALQNTHLLNDAHLYFDFTKVKIWNEQNLDLFDYELTNYKLQLIIPQTILDIENNKELDVDLNFELNLFEGHEKATISLTINHLKFEATNSFMELILDDLQKQFHQKFRFKNCYGCAFGDYSVYGQGFLGPILCFKNQKEAYLKVKNKQDYLDLEPFESSQQEFYCCSEFKIRKDVIGYRGTVI